MISFVTQNWQEIIAAVGGIVLAARVIVKLTPTPKDDTILEKIVGIFKHVGLHIDKPKDK